MANKCYLYQIFLFCAQAIERFWPYFNIITHLIPDYLEVQSWWEVEH